MVSVWLLHTLSSFPQGEGRMFRKCLNFVFSVFSGDQGQYIKIAHEISHAWFGIMIGSLDWTEAWLSEGFATFLEEIIHDEVSNKD